MKILNIFNMLFKYGCEYNLLINNGNNNKSLMYLNVRPL